MLVNNIRVTPESYMDMFVTAGHTLNLETYEKVFRIKDSDKDEKITTLYTVGSGSNQTQHKLTGEEK